MSDNEPQFQTDDGSLLRLWTDAAENRAVSEKVGRPMFDEVIYVQVISPGSRGSQPVFEVLRNFCKEAEMDEPRKSVHYAKFEKYIEQYISKDGPDGSLAGTALKEWPEIGRSLAATMRAQEIYTVEALANLPDEKLKRVGPDGRTWRTKAQEWLKSVEGAGDNTALAARAQVLEDDLAARDKTIAELSARIADLEAKLAAGNNAKAAKKTEKSDTALETAPII